MHRFFDTHIRPVLAAAGARTLCEIGVQSGAGTRSLLDYVAEVGGHLHCIDPDYPASWHEIRSEFEAHGTYHLGLSLDRLPDVPPCDAYLVDGDHNHYTVSNELASIADTVKERAAVVFLHDVDWPYGRRDLYYDPETIPPEARQPWMRRGLVPGEAGVVDEGGLNAHLANAVREGGPRNGVRTAAEDFVAAHTGWQLSAIPGIFGLGYLVSPSSDDAVRAVVRERTELGPAGESLVRLVERERIRVLAGSDSDAAWRRRALELEARVRWLETVRLPEVEAARDRARATLKDFKSRRGHQYLERMRSVVRRVRRIRPRRD